jgi:hypothetical protein
VTELAFGEWVPLDVIRVATAPDGPAAVQVRRAVGLVDYPAGKSAMVYYFFASKSARMALVDLFADEIEAPGTRGQGPLWFRFLEGAQAEPVIARLFEEFQERFGAAPVLHEA